MPKFTVTIGRDARAYFTGTIEAASMAEAKARLSGDSFESKPGEAFGYAGYEAFGQIETCDIIDEDGEAQCFVVGEGWGG